MSSQTTVITPRKEISTYLGTDGALSARDGTLGVGRDGREGGAGAEFIELGRRGIWGLG